MQTTEPTKISLSYGQLPDDLYERIIWACEEMGVYRIRNCKRVGFVDFTPSELEAEIKAAIEEWESLPSEDLFEDEIEWEVTASPDDVDYRGNCSAIGIEEDAATEKWIQEELESGNEWAWCQIEVCGRLGDLEASEYLGGCSYKSKEDFMQPGCYFDDMKREVISQLKTKLEEAQHNTGDWASVVLLTLNVEWV
jgi:hypothetical protein